MARLSTSKIVILFLGFSSFLSGTALSQQATDKFDSTNEEDRTAARVAQLNSFRANIVRTLGLRSGATAEQARAVESEPNLVQEGSITQEEDIEFRTIQSDRAETISPERQLQSAPGTIHLITQKIGQAPAATEVSDLRASGILQTDNQEQDRDQAGLTLTARYDLGLLNKPIHSIEASPAFLNGDVPQDSSFKMLDYSLGHYPRCVGTTFYWCAADICYQPLYFEDVLLERYGQTKGCFKQPWVSAAHFFASVALLPINMKHEHPNSCQYPLGYCLPGKCTPTMRQWLIRSK